MAALVVFLIWRVSSGPERPEPRATRHHVEGTVTEVGLRLCVKGPSVTASGDAERAVWCGIAEGELASVAVGDKVVGQIIDVELDPGSGASWSLWESLDQSA